MKSPVVIAQEALVFLQKCVILWSETMTKSHAERRKISQLFKCFEPEILAYNQQVKIIEDKYKEPKTVKDAQGNEHEQFEIPLKNTRDYQEAMVAIGNEKITAEFDPESLSLMRKIFMELDEIPQVKSTGLAQVFNLSGNLLSKYVYECVRALDLDAIVEQQEQEAEIQKANSSDDINLEA